MEQALTRPQIDDVTLRRARGGNDAAAMTTVINHHSAAVWALVSRMLVGHRPLVQDVTQDVFVKVMQALPNFDPNGTAQLSTWILTIATRTCIDVLRRARPTIALNDENEAGGIHLGCATQPVESNDLYRKVTAAMLRLSDEQRAVLVLRAYHDLDTDEIAAALEVEPGTVKSRLSRARQALRQAIGEEVFE